MGLRKQRAKADVVKAHENVSDFPIFMFLLKSQLRHLHTLGAFPVPPPKKAL